MANCLIGFCYISFLLNSFELLVSSHASDLDANQQKFQNHSIKNENSRSRRNKPIQHNTREDLLSSYGINKTMFGGNLLLAEFNNTSSRRSTTATRPPKRAIKLRKPHSIPNTSKYATRNHRHNRNTRPSSRKQMRWITTPKINIKLKAQSRMVFLANETSRQQRHHVKQLLSHSKMYRQSLPEPEVFPTPVNKTNAVNTFLLKHPDLIVQKIKYNNGTINHESHTKRKRQMDNRRTNKTQSKVIQLSVIRRNGNNTNTRSRRNRVLKVPKAEKASRKALSIVVHKGHAVSVSSSEHINPTTKKYQIYNATKHETSNKNTEKLKALVVAATENYNLSLNSTRIVNNKHVFQNQIRSKGLNEEYADISGTGDGTFAENVSTTETAKYSGKIFVEENEDGKILMANSKLLLKPNHEITTGSVKELSSMLEKKSDFLTTTSVITISDILSTITTASTKIVISNKPFPVIKAPPKSITHKEKERQKEYEHQTFFARILRFLNKKNTFKQYGFTASVRVNREIVANGFVINEESILTVLLNYHITVQKDLSVRVGQGSESQIQEVISVIPYYQGDMGLNNTVIVILKVKYLFEFAKTVYGAQISGEKPKKRSIVATEWKYTNSPSEHLDIPLKLVNYNVGLSRHAQCAKSFGDNYDKTKFFCVLRPVKKNGAYCNDPLGTLLVKKNTEVVLGILVTQVCNRIVAFAKLSKIKEWITYNTMLQYSYTIEQPPPVV